MSAAAYQTARTMAQFMESRLPINAIKQLRSHPGVDFSLKAAKDVVDRAPGGYYHDILYFESVINKRLDELAPTPTPTPKFVSVITTVTNVLVNIPGRTHTQVAPYRLTVEEAKQLRDALNSLDLG